jgi:ribosome modulation factor
MSLARTIARHKFARLALRGYVRGQAGQSANGCDAPMFPADLGPEWYRRLRDALNRMVN